MRQLPRASRTVGVDAIVGMLRRLLEPPTGFLQMTPSGVVRLDGDRATARFVGNGARRVLKRAYAPRYLDTSAFGGQVFALDAAAQDQPL